jgi:prophage regulatory protein
MGQKETQRQILRLPTVKGKVGLGRTKIYELISQGLFPAPQPIAGSRAVGWDSLAVQAWIDQQLDAQ